MSPPAERAADPPADPPAASPAADEPAGGAVWADPVRGGRFDAWLNEVAARHQLRVDSLRPASADASFRRYFRVDRSDGASLIVMDAPPPQEDVRPFIDVANRIAAAGLPAARVLEAQVEHGFLLTTDLGSRLLLAELQAGSTASGAAAPHADALMRDAVRLLVAWQQRVDPTGLPAYDDALLRRELALFPDWCVAREFGVQWDAAQQADWQAACNLLVANALAQPRVAVHRDYMPRNLMVSGPATASPVARAPVTVAGGGRRDGAVGGAPAIPPTLGMLDFQDAVHGPITYDMASLLRDAFIDWDEEQELDWAVRYWEQARKAGLLAGHDVADDFGELWRQLEWIGLQRHLKVLGIFCRLKHRDGKAAYSADLPRFFGYVHKVATRYQGFGPLARLVEPLMGTTRVDVFR